MNTKLIQILLQNSAYKYKANILKQAENYEQKRKKEDRKKDTLGYGRRSRTDQQVCA